MLPGSAATSCQRTFLGRRLSSPNQASRRSVTLGSDRIVDLCRAAWTLRASSADQRSARVGSPASADGKFSFGRPATTHSSATTDGKPSTSRSQTDLLTSPRETVTVITLEIVPREFPPPSRQNQEIPVRRSGDPDAEQSLNPEFRGVDVGVRGSKVDLGASARRRREVRMVSEMTPDGRHGLDTLCAIRQRMDASPGSALRPEELAMLKEWYSTCRDPERRRELGEIIRVFG